METFAIGNKVKCIIRSFAPGKLGSMNMQYANQPYTVIKDVAATLTYGNTAVSAQNQGLLLHYDVDRLDTVILRDVTLTDKILKLIYDEHEHNLCHHVESFAANPSGQVALSTLKDTIYQVFVYNDKNELIRAEGTLELQDGCMSVATDTDITVFYTTTEGESVNLNRNTSTYVTLDIEICGNVNDQTSHMWVHLGTCGLSINKNLTFNTNTNAIDLTFSVMKDSDNYITFVK